MGGNKSSAVAVLLALVVALAFFAGQSSARISSIDFARLIQGGAAAEVCKECLCTLDGLCVCYDSFYACPSFCSGGCWCSHKMAVCECVKAINRKWCESTTLKRPIGGVVLDN